MTWRCVGTRRHGGGKGEEEMDLCSPLASKSSLESSPLPLPPRILVDPPPSCSAIGVLAPAMTDDVVLSRRLFGDAPFDPGPPFYFFAPCWRAGYLGC